MHILITGSSRGIGRACAEHFAGRGWVVTALARSADGLGELERAYPDRIVSVIADLTDRGLPPLGAAYDVVLLNAGSYLSGGLLGEADVFAEMLALNVIANHRLARRLVPGMRHRGRGHLVAIGSVATDGAAAHMTAYAATKTALRGLYAGWELELADSGVRTTLIAPGATLTSSWKNEAPPPRILQASQVAELVYRAVTEGLTGRLVIEP
jgi:short-subunit dehydrogenase